MLQVEQHRIGRSPSSYTWSPTDDQLAYATQDEVRVAQTDGTSRVTLDVDLTKNLKAQIEGGSNGGGGVGLTFEKEY